MDDVLSMLLAFSARKEDLEVLLLSVTFGNVEVERFVLINPWRRVFNLLKPDSWE